MRLVAKNQPGDPYVVVEELAPSDSLVLRHWWADGRDELDSRRQVGDILARVAQRKLWIACDCAANAADPPVLFPREKDGRYTIQRGTTAGRAEHTPQCPFRWEPGELLGRQGSQRDPMASPARRQTNYLLYRTNEHLASAPDPVGIRPNSGADRSNELQTILFDILSRAHINRFDGTTDSWTDDRQRVRDACAAVSLFDEVDLEDIVWTSPKWLTEGWALNKLRKLRADGGWPSNVPMQGFFLVSAKQVTAHTVVCHGSVEMRIERPVTVFAELARAPEPYVAIVSARLDDQSGGLRLVRAYAHPRYADQRSHPWSLCPVDSDGERDALGALLYVARKAREQGVTVTVEKPLFDLIPAGAGEPCRPDFVLRLGERALCVETMKSRNPEYRSRKARTHTSMRLLGELVEDERCGVDPGRANKLLIAKVFATLRASGVLQPSQEPA